MSQSHRPQPKGMMYYSMTVLDRNLKHLLHHLRILHSRKDVITVCFLVGAVIVPFVHLQFGGKVINGIITGSHPMEARWYVYFLGQEVSSVLLSVFIYRVVWTRFRFLAWLYFVYCVYDMILFFWCFNESTYYYVPYAVMLFVSWKMYKG